MAVSSDDFEGLANLVGYLENYGIDINDWDMNKFRSALDFYLNHSFDLSKLLTFVRFYVRSAESALS